MGADTKNQQNDIRGAVRGPDIVVEFLAMYYFVPLYIVVMVPVGIMAVHYNDRFDQVLTYKCGAIYLVVGRRDRVNRIKYC